MSAFSPIGLLFFRRTSQSVKHRSPLKNLTSLYGLLIFSILLIGCGAQTKVLKAPVEITKPAVPKGVAILPLADYSQREPFIEPYRYPNLLIIEEITQNLIGQGFNVAVQEDVNKFLISEKVIEPLSIETQLPPEILQTLANFNKDRYGRWYGISYNPPRNDEANEKKILEKLNKELETAGLFQDLGVKGLDQETVIMLARKLNADIIFRGRILEYGFKNKDTLNPLQGAGLLAFLIDEPKKFIFGVTSKEKYDTVGEQARNTVESILMGGTVGLGIGAAAHGAVTGGLIGGGLGLLRAGKERSEESSVMHIRLYAQDGKTGQIIWTNAIEVERTPTSMFAFDEKHPKVLLDKLTREGVKLLIEDFIKNTGSLN